MSENSERKGMVWARWRAKLWRSADEERVAAMLLDDERRALVRVALQGFLSNPSLRLSGDDHAAGITEASALLADAVLARYDEEVRGE